MLLTAGRHPRRHHGRRLTRLPDAATSRSTSEWQPGIHGKNQPKCTSAGCHDPHTPSWIYIAALPPFQGTGIEVTRGRSEREPFKPFASPPVAPPVYTPLWLAIMAVDRRWSSSAGHHRLPDLGKAHAMSKDNEPIRPAGRGAAARRDCTLSRRRFLEGIGATVGILAAGAAPGAHLGAPAWPPSPRRPSRRRRRRRSSGSSRRTSRSTTPASRSATRDARRQAEVGRWSST